MPSGPSHWHEFWDNDQRAWSYLRKRGFRCIRGVIVPPDSLIPDVLDLAAIDYLCCEWDYGYQPPPVVGCTHDRMKVSDRRGEHPCGTSVMIECVRCGSTFDTLMNTMAWNPRED